MAIAKRKPKYHRWRKTDLSSMVIETYCGLEFKKAQVEYRDLLSTKIDGKDAIVILGNNVRLIQEDGRVAVRSSLINTYTDEDDIIEIELTDDPKMGWLISYLGVYGIKRLEIYGIECVKLVYNKLDKVDHVVGDYGDEQNPLKGDIFDRNKFKKRYDWSTKASKDGTFMSQVNKLYAKLSTEFPICPIPINGSPSENEFPYKGSRFKLTNKKNAYFGYFTSAAEEEIKHPTAEEKINYVINSRSMYELMPYFTEEIVDEIKDYSKNLYKTLSSYIKYKNNPDLVYEEIKKRDLGTIHYYASDYSNNVNYFIRYYSLALAVAAYELKVEVSYKS